MAVKIEVPQKKQVHNFVGALVGALVGVVGALVGACLSEGPGYLQKTADSGVSFGEFASRSALFGL